MRGLFSEHGLFPKLRDGQSIFFSFFFEGAGVGLLGNYRKGILHGKKKLEKNRAKGAMRNIKQALSVIHVLFFLMLKKIIAETIVYQEQPKGGKLSHAPRKLLNHIPKQSGVSQASCLQSSFQTRNKTIVSFRISDH